ncbi:phosphatase PAP2 family protein [Rhizobium herbae]|uniref:Undecaprenyl-diphosphatase n=1 Tax=Rhizobium herbae TaxID=508661 RepID=A0ABS4ELC5_9HYPH|nr:phosphatase PAP2 family protein [Rhizobium herbae]MBP1858720.1 undecaprenyl-diphosphatase [Rhizobium herbae]
MDTLLAVCGIAPKLPETRCLAVINPLYLFCCVNLVFIALVLFDTCVAAAAGRFPLLAIEFGRTFTHVGKSGWILLIAGYIFLAGLAKLRENASGKGPPAAQLLTAAAAYIFVTVALSGLAANLLKRAIGRARPQFFDHEGIFSFSPFSNNAAYESFPSGHATTAAALFVGLALLLPSLRAPLLVAGIWIGLARVIVGAHYPSDVIAGLALGAWFALAVAAQFARYGILFTINAAGWPETRYPPAPREPQADGTLSTDRA